MLEPMTSQSRFKAWFSRTGSEALGWILLLIGIPMLPLPGPGTVVLVTGVALLARHYSWARSILEPLRERAIQGAKYGVATRKRIVVSALGGLWIFVLGIVWIVSPKIPEWSIGSFEYGPHLPGGGWFVGVIVTGLGVAALYFLSKSVGWNPLSIVPGVLLIAVGAVWAADPDIGVHVVDVGVGPRLPGAGWLTGLAMMLSAIAAWVVLAICIKRYRGLPADMDLLD